MASITKKAFEEYVKQAEKERDSLCKVNEDLVERIAQLEAKNKKEHKLLNDRLEVVEHQTNETKRLSKDAFRAFCIRYEHLGAWISEGNYQRWRASDGQLVFTWEDDQKKFSSKDDKPKAPTTTTTTTTHSSVKRKIPQLIGKANYESSSKRRK